ncbi:TetR/AcrR family transcriptional regulator [[Mycobacterium] wendilense]|uniref:TetR/AcrR family transcriptional regulator n=1 Tax=[Mycobacterium] wendilense TaxID=3064284 RepID=A0ABM9M7Z6_9MYCO|nr:TetR/AcrR family transcriptional regulator [Mycolicibacterium sp. MU0050]CAJ1578454.1 TetR/AcrR family transcriptional regulator [Mycolicibacterium sp. MU0050]
MTTVGPSRANRGRRPVRPSGDDREQAILATARRLLQERSFADISVVDLAKGAGLSRPTFYFYFPSKEAVLLSLLDPLIQRADSGLSDISAVPSDPRRAFRDGIHTFFSSFAADPVLARAGAEAISTNPEVRELWSGFMQKWIDQTAALIAAERHRGAAPDTMPAQDLATALNQMNERAMIAAISDEQAAVAPERLVETLTHIWMASIYGTPSHLAQR